MITLILISVFLISISMSISEAAKLKENIAHKKISKLWHWTQWVYRLIFAMYVLIVSWPFITIPLILLVLTIHWIIYDGAINIGLGKSFFHMTTTSTSDIDILLGDKKNIVKFVFLVLSVAGLLIY